MDVHPTKPPHILEVIWCPPTPSWLKVNMNGEAFGGPDLAGCAGIFRTCRDFVKGYFVIPLSICFAFEADLAATVHAMEYS